MSSQIVRGAIVRCIENKSEVLLVKYPLWAEHDEDVEMWGLPGGEVCENKPYVIDSDHVLQSVLHAELAYGVGWSVLYNLQCEQPFEPFHTTTVQRSSEICTEMFFRCMLKNQNVQVILDDKQYSDYRWVEIAKEHLFDKKFPLAGSGRIKTALTCLLK